MTTPAISPSVLGERTTRIFYPPYSLTDWRDMAVILDDATLHGLAAVRFIHDDRVTITTIGS